MTITLEIRPEVQHELARQAEARGVGIGDYVARLLEDAAQAASISPVSPGPKDMVELFEPLRGQNLIFERDRDPGRDLSL
jgi:hypothetical protein